MNTFIGAYNTVMAGLQNINIFQSAPQKQQVEGYLMHSDSTNNRTLLLVKENNNSWRTEWFSNNENTYKSPQLPLSEIFNKRN
jgi:hypothetical protein